MDYAEGAAERRRQLRDALDASRNRPPRDVVPPVRTDAQVHSGRQRITWIEEVLDADGNVIGLVEMVDEQYVTAAVMPIRDPEHEDN